MTDAPPESRFRNRSDAGRRLAEALRAYRRERPVVLGLPRGGVVVAKEVALALDAPLDVIVTRKLGAPGQPEVALGAVAPGGVVYLDAHYRWDRRDLQAAVTRERRELERRTQLYRGTKEMPDVRGRVVILVDDGIATGITAFSAVRALRRNAPRRLVLAVPVCPEEVAEQFEREVDELVCPLFPDDFLAVGAWYDQFEPVSDAEVLACLEAVRARREPGRSLEDERED